MPPRFISETAEENSFEKESFENAEITETLSSQSKLKENTKFTLLSINEVPDYAKEDSITTGYRKQLDYRGCVLSMFRLHNETVNIWTHLLGFVVFFCLMLDNLVRPQQHIRDFVDYAATTFQLVTYQACMLSSSLFHTFLCHSAKVKTAWQELDHACILIAMFGTYIRIIINNFNCFPSIRLLHLILVTLLFGSVLYLKYSPASSNTKVSLPLFFSVAIYSVAPFTHWIHLSQEIENSNVDSTMICWMFLPFILGAIGVLFYISHFPEVAVPCGCVDFYGASHQIWHVLIFSGMVSWYYLSCWVSTTRPETCKLVSHDGTNDGYSSLLNCSLAQILDIDC